MREIKFRAWNGNEILETPIANSWGLGRFFGFLGEADIVMQYTNYRSFDNKEIYEDDQVSVEFDELGSEIPINFDGIVKFIESGFYVVNDERELSFPVFQEIAKWKITGNIHTQPIEDKR